MIPQRDPAIEELVAGHLEQKRQVQQARDDEEHTRAREALASLEAEEAAELPAWAKRVDAKRAVRDRAEQEYFAEAATLENKRSHWSTKRQLIFADLKRTIPQILRDALANLGEHLVTERARYDVDPTARARHDLHVSGLYEAMDRVWELAAVDPAKIPERLRLIRAGIPARYDGGPVKTVSFIEQQASGIREYLKSRFRGDTI